MTILSLSVSHLPDHFYPFRYLWVWLSRRKPLVSAIALQYMEHPDVDKVDAEERDLLYQPLTRTNDDKHNDSVCCRMAQCPREPNTSGRVSSYWNCIALLGTCVCKETKLINPLLSEKCQFSVKVGYRLLTWLGWGGSIYGGGDIFCASSDGTDKFYNYLATYRTRTCIVLVCNRIIRLVLYSSRELWACIWYTHLVFRLEYLTSICVIL